MSRNKPYSRPESRPEPRSLDERWKHDRRDPEERLIFTVSNTRPSTRAIARVLVENLHWEVTQDDLETLLKDFDGVVAVRLLYDSAGRSDGKAEIDFDDLKEAERVVYEYDGVPLDGLTMALSIVKIPQPRQAPRPRQELSRRIGLPEDGKSKSVFDRLGRLPVTARLGGVQDRLGRSSHHGSRGASHSSRGASHSSRGSSHVPRRGGNIRHHDKPRKPQSAADLDADLDAFLNAVRFKHE
jgi:THO complex subunit 4